MHNVRDRQDGLRKRAVERAPCTLQPALELLHCAAARPHSIFAGRESLTEPKWSAPSQERQSILARLPPHACTSSVLLIFRKCPTRTSSPSDLKLKFNWTDTRIRVWARWLAAVSGGARVGGRHRLEVQAGAMDAVATRGPSKTERVLSPDSQGSPCIPRSDQPIAPIP